MTIESIEIGQAGDDKVTVTLRGDATEIVNVLADGLSREALAQLIDALTRELDARRTREG